MLNGPALDGEGGVEQGDIDAILKQSGDTLESNQDDVDALFDQVGDSVDLNDTDVFETAVDDIEFDSIQVETVADDFPEAADVVDDGVLTGLEEGEDETVMVDMSDLDWSDDDDTNSAPEAQSTTKSSDNVEPVGQADVFASAANAEATPIVDDTSDVMFEEADMFASTELETVGADIFASADSGESEGSSDVKAPPQGDELATEMEAQLADLRDRVADFS